MSGMSSVAEHLHQAREARHLTLQQVAEITKIRTDHLRALEEGDYSVFSAPVYIRGFVRSYSTLLKLDVAQVMLSLDAELGQNKRFSEPPALTTGSGGFLDAIMLQFSKLDWRKTVVVLGAAVLLGGIIVGTAAWRHYRKSDPLKGLKPATYQPKPGAGETLPLPSAPPKR